MSTPPLHGIRIIEFAGIGPGPFAAMMLADHGAEVIRVERPSLTDDAALKAKDPLLRNRRTIALDLKEPTAIAAVRQIVRGADAIIEGFRPGVMERLGLGPDVLLNENPKLVYGRMTGWGQTGPMAHEPGHDINYIAVSGTLHAIGRRGEKPTPPINLVGDFGGGGMLLAFGILAALLHARTTGEGQVVDAAMTDGSALLMAMIWGFRAQGRWSDERGANRLDTGAPFYDVYETADGRYVSVAANEPQFFAALRRVLGLEDDNWEVQHDQEQWPAQKEELNRLFLTRTRDAWVETFKGHEVCFAPVLGFDEAFENPHNRFRETFMEIDGVRQPSPAPRYSVSRTVPPRMANTGYDAGFLQYLGLTAKQINDLCPG